MRLALLLGCALLACASASAETTVRVKLLGPGGVIVERGEGTVEEPRDEMSSEQRQAIMATLEQNRTRLVAEGKLSREHAKALTNFAWPLRFAAGRTDFEFHGISNFVDENPAYPDQLLDYMCGARTYDRPDGYNHAGTDISTWPYRWNKMDNEDVVIAAGAAGTIINKTDGYYDRNCATGAGTWNAVYVQHADGSVAWYGHMKNGSPTTKGIGETVVTGEYLGIVGSSGNSTGPHLHLELYDPSNALVDPWLGACNAKSKQVTWARQRPYRDTGVNALTVGTAAPDYPACPNPESSFATDYVTPATPAYFTVSMRDQLVATPVAIRLLRPDGSVHFAPTPYTPPSDSNQRFVYWYFTSFPNTPGTWTFEATIAGKLYRKNFQVGGSANYGAPASIAVAAGNPQATAPNMPFATSLRVRVLDSLARPVKNARVTFAAPVSGATAIAESRTAVTDAAGYAAVTALANAASGGYSVNATVPGAGAPATFALQNTPAVVVGVSAAPVSVDFGGQSLNTTSTAVPVTLTNSTAGALTVISLTVPAGFAATHNCTTLAPGANCVATLTFTPAQRGRVAGFLAIQTGAGTTRTVVAGTGEFSLVTHYYRSILRRAPDAPGKAFWEDEAARLAGLGANVNETWFAMAQQFYFSPEYLAFNRSDAEFVTDLYTTFFNRAPDGGGLAFWTGQVAGGMPREVVLASFMFSTEFAAFTQAIFGNAAVRAEANTVVDFYRGLLARLPDDGGFGHWAQQFRTAQCAGAGAVYVQVASISSAFADSGEYVGRGRTNAQYVGDLYNSFLRRGGDLAGVQYWINQLDTAALTRLQVREQFIASAEFNGRVTAIVNQGCPP